MNVAKAPRSCSLCGSPEHDRRTCPQTGPWAMDNLEDAIEEAALLRMRRDALREEIEQYRAMVAEFERRITENYAAIERANREIELARVRRRDTVSP